MIFGRVQAIAEPVEGRPEAVRIVVWLERGAGIETVRDELLPALRDPGTFDGLAWSADQYAQETIATALAEEGWEVIGGSEMPAAVDGGAPRSATYAVRKLTKWE